MNDDASSSLRQLIGFGTISRPLESWYTFVARLIRANLLNDKDIRQQLPPDWIRWAFAPHDVQAHDLAPLDPYREQLPQMELKLTPAAWQPFPTLSSAPPECLRGCPRCLESGYHSYAMQGDLIARCPVHDEPLVHRCPHCNTQLLWLTHSPGLSAFHCPAGCALLEGVHNGLYVPHEDDITEALQEHWAWTKTLRETFTFVSGPVHIAYPPYVRVAPLRMPPLPSSGLLPAVLHALQATGLPVPAFARYHEQSHGNWTISVQPWLWNEGETSSKEASEEETQEPYRRAFRRGAYRTSVPMIDCESFGQWLSASENVHGHWHDGVVEEGRHCSIFTLPSYLVTNNELNALRRLLTRDSNPRLGAVHYQQMLIELLEHARLRRIALDHLEAPSPAVTVAETFGAIILTASGHWHLSGHTQGDDASRETWRDFREPAEMSSGLIHVMRRHGPR